MTGMETSDLYYEQMNMVRYTAHVQYMYCFHELTCSSKRRVRLKPVFIVSGKVGKEW